MASNTVASRSFYRDQVGVENHLNRKCCFHNSSEVIVCSLIVTRCGEMERIYVYTVLQLKLQDKYRVDISLMLMCPSSNRGIGTLLLKSCVVTGF